MRQIQRAPAGTVSDPRTVVAPEPSLRQRLADARWNPRNWHLLARGLPSHIHLRLRSKAPLVVLAVALVAQVLLPDPVWVMVIVTLAALHIIGYLWARALALGVEVERKRDAMLILAGDELEEEFRVENHAIVPLLWLEIQDGGDFPDYNVGRVVSCGARNEVRWRTKTLCRQRGLFRLGPLTFATGDPFRLFAVTVTHTATEPILIYPRVAHLSEIPLARGNADADARVYRHLQGALPAPTVREHVPSEGLRHVHWPATAHHGRLMVRERQQEPAGDIWIVADAALPAPDFERIVTLAASAAAQILDGVQRRKVGLLCASGIPAQLAIVPPDNGQAHIWQILAALARVQTSDVALATILREARSRSGARDSLAVITSSVQETASVERWVAELARIDRRSPGACVILAATAESAPQAESIHAVLARQEMQTLTLPDDVALPTRGMIRRTRRVVKSTPTGGSYAVEIEEEG